MSVQAVKAVEIGSGMEAAVSPGSSVHDEIGYDRSAVEAGRSSRVHASDQSSGRNRRRHLKRRRCRGAWLFETDRHAAASAGVRWISRPAKPVKASYERSDICVVPAAGVVAEAMVALTLARVALDKFGGDSMTETLRNFRGYLEQLREF